jgi:hypothetical protein
MAIPTGAGTEVLKRTITDNVGSGNVKVIDGDADHIYTVLSIIFFAHSTTNFEIKIAPSAGSYVFVLSYTGLAANATFTFNDKFCLTGTDELVLRASSGECDIVTTYIDQHF